MEEATFVLGVKTPEVEEVEVLVGVVEDFVGEVEDFVGVTGGFVGVVFCFS